MARNRGHQNVPTDLLIPLRALLDAGSQSAIKNLQDQNTRDLRLSEFVREYVATPEALGLEGRSSFREDSVIVELRTLLSANARELTIIDLCCGEANVARCVMDSIGLDARRIHIWAVDGDIGCIEALQNSAADFSKLASFNPVVRMIPDIGVCADGHADAIILNNALHEIPPRYFARMFTNFDGLLLRPTGRVYIIDMSELPLDAPESVAIAWTGDEVCTFLRAGGLDCKSTVHDKSVPVYRVVIQPSCQAVDGAAINRVVLGSLMKKQEASIDRLRTIRRDAREKHEGVQEWIVAAGTVARLADEIDFMRRSMGVS